MPPSSPPVTAGVSLLALCVNDVSTGLFGRTVMVLGDQAHRPLPAHRFSVGDIVGIRGTSGAPGAVKHDVTGVLSRVTELGIWVTVDDGRGKDAERAEDAIDGLPDRVRMDLLANDVTYRRLSDALAALGKYQFGPAARLVNM